MTKICDIPYPIPEQKFETLFITYKPYGKIPFQTCVMIGSLVQTNFKLP